MHELGITKSIVAICAENAGNRPVKRVVLEIGALSDVMAESVRFCFDVCAKGTVVEGATLEIHQPPGKGRCMDCGAEMKLDAPFGVCEDCGSYAVAITAGQELAVKSLEV